MAGIKAKERLNYIDNIVSTYEGKDLDWYKKVLFKNPHFKDGELTPHELRVLNRAMLSSEDGERYTSEGGSVGDIDDNTVGGFDEFIGRAEKFVDDISDEGLAFLMSLSMDKVEMLMQIVKEEHGYRNDPRDY